MSESLDKPQPYHPNLDGPAEPVGLSMSNPSAIGESSRPDDVLERCASILEHRASEWDSAVREGSEQRGYEEAVLMECAGAIRSLKGTYAPSHEPEEARDVLSEREPTKAKA